jgi:hypothetical protein
MDNTNFVKMISDSASSLIEEVTACSLSFDFTAFTYTFTPPPPFSPIKISQKMMQYLKKWFLIGALFSSRSYNVQSGGVKSAEWKGKEFRLVG